MSSIAIANPLPTGPIPIPTPRPYDGIVTQAAPSPGVSRETTASIVRTANPASVTPISGSLKSGLDALSDNKILRARGIRDGMRAGTLDRQVLTWAIARSGAKDVPSADIAAAARELQGWPGLSSLRYNSEKALHREDPPAREVVAAFGNTAPETAEGTIVLCRALVATGDRERARQLISALWRKHKLDADEEKEILATLSGLLSKADHKHRMEMLLYRDRAKQAARFAELSGAQSLYRARAAVIRKSSDAKRRLNGVHRMWHNDPSFLYAKVHYLRDNNRDKEAAQLLAKIPRDKAKLINPDAWWIEQRVVSRALYEAGDARGAYRIASQHVATGNSAYAEAEFHAGWYALRGMRDGKTAIGHFNNMLKVAKRPITKARAYYWMGRASQAGGGGNAKDYYAAAAKHPTTFYGQLAASRIGQKSLNVRYPSPSQAERDRFAARSVVKAIKRLEQANHGWRADILYRALAYELTSPGELAILSSMAERRGAHQVSLQIGKIAYGRGLDVAALAYPLGVIPKSANISGSGKALAYAIARQESAFNKAAVSPANAMGLLQLLPGTAKGVAKRHGLSYSKSKLTRDAGYNATLGAHFLGEQISEFGGSYILTFIAYNAGPRRVPQWIERFGDPRGRKIDDVVDWIEQIPFTETRHYVQRVMENYQVYKTRLGQRADVVRDLTRGR